MRKRATVASLLIGWLGTGCSGVPTLPDRPFATPYPVKVPLQICWGETGRAISWGGVATAGWHQTATWDATASFIVVRHPKGDLLIDTGKSFRLEEEEKQLRPVQALLAAQIMGPLKDVETAPSALRKLQIDPSKIHGIVLTHGHGDHAGGVVDLPGVPVWLPPEEIYFLTHLKDAGNFRVFKDQVEALEGRMQPIAFRPIPYEVFSESADFFGDGSVVIVPLFGHTPGSVGVFINLGPHLRIFHVGDAVAVREGFERPARKGQLLALTDLDPDRTAEIVALLHQLHRRDPDLFILPAHDRPAWRQLFGSEAPSCRGGQN